jgi:hypothetical protein
MARLQRLAQGKKGRAALRLNVCGGAVAAEKFSLIEAVTGQPARQPFGHA